MYILTEVFVRYLYSPDTTHCVFFFSLTIVPFWDRIFKASLHLQFQHECIKYAYILVQQGKVYAFLPLFCFVFLASGWLCDADANPQEYPPLAPLTPVNPL